MRITLEQTVFKEGLKVTIEENHDEQDISTMFQLFGDALVAFGYAQKCVDDILEPCESCDLIKKEGEEDNEGCS